jgi:mono/diheme cytochrome c family protein
VGLWKKLHLTGETLTPVNSESADWNRGRYLVEALGHCGECHSPRGMTGAILADRRMAGGQIAGGDRAPNITPGKGGIGDWSEEDIALFLNDGTTPEGDVVGGEMGEVIANMQQLSDGDRQAMAIYLKALKPIDSAISESP